MVKLKKTSFLYQVNNFTCKQVYLSTTPQTLSVIIIRSIYQIENKVIFMCIVLSNLYIKDIKVVYRHGRQTPSDGNTSHYPLGQVS
jgi:hypothetical protein